MNDATSVPRPLLSMYSIQTRFRTIRWVSFSKPRTTRLSSSASFPKTIRPRHRTTAMSSVLETSSFRAMAPSGPSSRVIISPRRHRFQYKSKLVGAHCCCKIPITLIEGFERLFTSITPKRLPPQETLIWRRDRFACLVCRFGNSVRSHFDKIFSDFRPTSRCTRKHR
jgi:hypothetical protein